MFLVGIFVLLSSSETVLGGGFPLLACSDNSDITLELKHLTTKWTDDGGKLEFSSLEIDNLQNGATVCFDLSTPEGDMLEYAVKLEEVSGSTRFEDQYDFGVPNVTAKCTCSCSDKTNVLKECNADESGFCDGYGSDGRCVTKKEKTEVNTGCTGLMKDSDLCCAIQMKNSDIKDRFKAFRVRDQQQSFVKIKLYPSYSDIAINPLLIDNLEETQQITEDSIIFQDISVTREGSNDNGIFDAASWYIGESNPYSATVYETSEEVNLKDGYDISRVGWAKYQDGAYQLGQDRIQDDQILEAFSATVKDCGDSDITSAFHSTDLAEFKNSLVELKSKHSTYVDKVSWENSGEENHGKVDWTYKKSAYKIDLKFKLKGNYKDFTANKISRTSMIGNFKAQVVVSKHGEAYIEINMTESYGNIFGSYTIKDEDPLDFSFEVTNKTFYTEYYKHTNLECKKNAVGELCLNVEDKDSRCKTVLCSEKKIEDSDKKNSTIDTQTVVSDGPLNWKTWAKYANPLEWFNGISSYQEAIMLVVELLGMFGGVFLVLKILRMLNLLGKCCRCMFCCFLCPKTEQKIRKRASTMRANHRRRMTETKRHMTEGGRRFTATFKRENRVSSEGSKGEGRKKSFKETIRYRIDTAAAVQYLRRKVGREQGPEINQATNQYELEDGLPTTLPPTIQENVCEMNETTGHVNVVFDDEEVSGETKKPATKTVSFKDESGEVKCPS